MILGHQHPTEEASKPDPRRQPPRWARLACQKLLLGYWQIRTNSSTLWGLKDEEFKGFAVIAGGVRLSNGRHFVQPIALFIADVLSSL